MNHILNGTCILLCVFVRGHKRRTPDGGSHGDSRQTMRTERLSVYFYDVRFKEQRGGVCIGASKTVRRRAIGHAIRARTVTRISDTPAAVGGICTCRRWCHDATTTTRSRTMRVHTI